MNRFLYLLPIFAVIAATAPAFAQAKKRTVVEEVHKLDGQPVRVQLSTSYSDAGRGAYMVELSLSVAGEPFSAFDRRTSEGRVELSKNSAVKGGWFALSYSVVDHGLCGREARYVEDWGFDPKTKRPVMLRKSVTADGSEKLTSSSIAAIERGKKLPNVGHCSPYSADDQLEMLRAAERGVKRLHDAGKRREAAARVKALFEATLEKSGFLELASQGPSREKALEYEQAGFLTGDGKFRICANDYYDYTTTVDGCSNGWVDNAAKHAWLATNLGYYLSEGDEHAIAVQVLSAASKAYPDHTPVWLNLADAHHALGKKAEAKIAYERYAALRKGGMPERVRKRLDASSP